MTLMQLDGAAGVLVRAGNIQVALAVEPVGAAVAFAALETTGAALRTAHRTARDIVVERPRNEAVLRATAPDGGTFPDGTRMGLVLTVDVPGDADVVRVPPVDVSGLAARDLIRLLPDGDRLRILPGAAGVGDTRRLTPLGSVAVAETRRLAAGSVDPVPALRVAIDPSASMRHLAGPDDLGAVLEVLTGVREAIGAPDARFEIVVWADAPRVVPDEDPAALAQMALAALADTPPTIGFRSAGVAGPGLTIMITDAVPADVESLTGAVCLLVLGGDPSVTPVRPGVAVVALPVPFDGTGMRAALTGGALPGLVHGLLAPLRTGGL